MTLIKGDTKMSSEGLKGSPSEIGNKREMELKRRWRVAETQPESQMQNNLKPSTFFLSLSFYFFIYFLGRARGSQSFGSFRDFFECLF